jgi:hypothetical protein
MRRVSYKYKVVRAQVKAMRRAEHPLAILTASYVVIFVILAVV